MASSNPTGNGSGFGNQINYDDPNRNAAYENGLLIWDILHPPTHNATQEAVDEATTPTKAKPVVNPLFFIAIALIFFR